MTGPAFDHILRALEQSGRRVKMIGPNRARTWCTHDGADNPDGLSIVDFPDRVGLTCFTRGCDAADVLESIGLTVRDRYHDPKGATYHYDDGRTVHRTPGKDFRQSGNRSGTPTLYRLAQVRRAVAEGEPVYLVEGESDALALESVGVTATTAPMGAGNFAKVDVSPLAGADVLAVADRDEQGERWSRQVAAKLAGVAATVTFQQAVTGKDASDHLTAGHTVAEFVTVAAPTLDSTEQAPVDGPDSAEEARPASWDPVDLTAVLDGTYRPVEPALLPRADGVMLLYPGCTHSMHGESESGKSLVMQAEAARLIAAGRDVLYIDFESDAVSVVGRLRMFGAAVEDIAAHLDYRNPEASPFDTEPEREAWRAMLARPYALAVIDGVTDSVGLFGYSSKDNDELSTWQRVFPDALARRTGAAVVSIDHVTKDSEGRGRFAIGAQSKMAGLTGAAYTVEVVEPLGLGLRGVVVLRVAKDRPGQVRPQCGNFRKSDRTQEAARVVFDATGSTETVTVEPWSDATAPSRAGGEFRPTTLMERVSEALEAAGEPLSFRKVKGLVRGKEEHIRAALDVLTSEGFVTVRKVGQAQLHTLVKVYRQAADPLSDTFKPAGDGQADFSPQSDRLPSPGYTPGTRATDTHRLPGDGGRRSGDGGTEGSK